MGNKILQALGVGMILFLICATIVALIDEKNPEIFAKYQVITLKGSTFDMDVTVLITDDVPFATKYVKENLDSTVTASDFNARAVSFGIVDGKSPIIWMSSIEDQGVVAHELFHTTLNVMYWAGMELNSETEEAFAYEMQYLTNSFYNQIKPNK
jgi:hypothetical protein